MKLFIAALATESNTFSPIPTGREGFVDFEYFRNDGSLQPPQYINVPLIEWRRAAERDGHQIVESLSTLAQPGGRILKHVYEELRDTLLNDLRAAMPVHVVLLFMHGAMAADGYDDCEGDTLVRVREIVGEDARIGVELDLHCHLTEQMRQNADVIITFKEYPHTDVAARGNELYSLAIAAAKGEIAPAMAYYDCRMVNLWRTSMEPARSFVQRMQELEGHDGILSISFGHGFPWGDVADGGAKMLVIADGDLHKAEALAAKLGGEVWETREAAVTAYDTIDAGIDAVLANQAPLPVVLADVADNAGGGAPADNTEVLRRLIDRQIKDVAIGCFWDPFAVKFCEEVGVGVTFALRIGGKCGPSSGEPVDLLVTVRGVASAHQQTGLGGGKSPMGAAAWVEADGLHIILMSIRQQTFDPDAFTGLGCTLIDKRAVVVKSMQHFYAAFAPISSEIRFVAAPGALTPEYGSIAYEKRSTVYWPRVEDPFLN